MFAYETGCACDENVHGMLLVRQSWANERGRSKLSAQLLDGWSVLQDVGCSAVQWSQPMSFIRVGSSAVQAAPAWHQRKCS